MGLSFDLDESLDEVKVLQLDTCDTAPFAYETKYRPLSTMKLFLVNPNSNKRRGFLIQYLFRHWLH